LLLRLDTVSSNAGGPPGFSGNEIRVLDQIAYIQNFEGKVSSGTVDAAVALAYKGVHAAVPA
jgi:hypothetical protein